MTLLFLFFFVLFPEQYCKSLHTLIRDLAGNQLKILFLWQQFQATRLMYSFLLHFCKIALWFCAAEGLEEETKAQRKKRHRLAKPPNQAVWFHQLKSRGAHTCSRVAVFWGVASWQSVGPRVSGWPRGSRDCDDSVEVKSPGWLHFLYGTFSFNTTFDLAGSGYVHWRTCLHKCPWKQSPPSSLPKWTRETRPFMKAFLPIFEL